MFNTELRLIDTTPLLDALPLNVKGGWPYIFCLYILRLARGKICAYILRPYIFCPPQAEIFWLIYYHYIFWIQYPRIFFKYLCIWRRRPKILRFGGSQAGKFCLIYSLYILPAAGGKIWAYIFWVQEFCVKFCTIYSIYKTTPPP